jgi:hypothetical protein
VTCIKLPDEGPSLETAKLSLYLSDIVAFISIGGLYKIRFPLGEFVRAKRVFLRGHRLSHYFITDYIPVAVSCGFQSISKI